MQTLIEVTETVSFSYPKERRYVYYIPRGLTISQGEICSISGISGSGKSTILTLLASLRRFMRGNIIYRFSSYEDREVVVNQKSWSQNVGPDFWGNIGFSFQKPELIRALPVKMNLELALGDKTEEMALALFEPDEWVAIKHSRTWKISGGQIQRLGIIRAFGQNQNLVFMDEPTNNLDRDNREKVVNFIDVYGKNKAIILVSHDRLFLDMLNIGSTFEVHEEKAEHNYVKRVLRQVDFNRR